ncbi:alpha-galactosidase [Bifidobacterium sp. ESL0775]|uniref:alpha-galactosidase n=1 Tax=Bifidobacterium sp. ESL0775 TaxID=2983230 RepID=UPI0023F97918|nr:alpha-galactosidase [Bifidobacterium sp. ESL0775]WEV69382.1 alpha-galactosidase [Bifidobacterium sp. ESL0775]
MLFPTTNHTGRSVTCIALQDVKVGDRLPLAYGVFDIADPLSFGGFPAIHQHDEDAEPGMHLSGLLLEQSRGSFCRPNLRGQRIFVSTVGGDIGDTGGADETSDAGNIGGAQQTQVQTGADWSPRFVLTSSPRITEVDASKDIEDGIANSVDSAGFARGNCRIDNIDVAQTGSRRVARTTQRLTFQAEDVDAGLRLVTDIETMVGGSLRIRHTLTNAAPGAYQLQGLEVRVPLRDDQTQFLDFTGRHERERTPQRHDVADGMWLREYRHGRPGFEGTTLIAGRPGFDFGHGQVIEVQPAFSGNAVMAVERNDEDCAAISAGELLLPGEVTLAKGESYSTPWVVVTASGHGLDGVAHKLHRWERSLPTHPKRQPVTLNVWEAVYFNHDFKVLSDLAHRAADIGVERFVLDDGWFHLRRSDDAGLGDWWVDPEVWPQGLAPLADCVRSLGMEFGLWFEPEMVNPDSDMFRDHPEWILQARNRRPLLQRHQYVIDLTRQDAFDYVLEHVSEVLAHTSVDYVKWDCNRSFLEPGSNLRGGAPAAHAQARAYYRLLDALRSRFPNVQWESCASGGGRIDLGIVQHVSRFWTSDMTDALSRQEIQRWTTQIVAPELLGAHVSSPTSDQTGRTFTTAFRAATAAFYSFGIEWDIRKASPEDLRQLKAWVAWYKAERGFLHSGDYVRLDVADDAVLAYGVVAEDGSRAIIEHVQMDESPSNRGVWLRIPGLVPDARYRLTWTGPEPPSAKLETLDPAGPLGEATVTGNYLANEGVWIPRCRPETARLIDIVRQ